MRRNGKLELQNVCYLIALITIKSICFHAHDYNFDIKIKLFSTLIYRTEVTTLTVMKGKKRNL